MSLKLVCDADVCHKFCLQSQIDQLVALKYRKLQLTTVIRLR
jgi:hypothetical protein